MNVNKITQAIDGIGFKKFPIAIKKTFEAANGSSLKAQKIASSQRFNLSK